MSPERIIANTFVVACEVHAALASTNDRALALGRDAATALPLVVVADQQTAGRGRGSHRWWTGHGSLAFSLLTDRAMCAAAPGRPPLVALAAGVAVVEAVAPLVPVTVGLHWPNDVFAAGRKLAGILVEVLPNGRHVIGIGLNANNRAADAPAELRDAVATLCDLSGYEQDREAVLIAILRQIADKLAALRIDGADIARQANEACLQRGGALTFRCGDEIVSGVCDGIAPDGTLRLSTATGVRHVVSASVW
jgi:BirA family biotin operon repressor/biotin-[acetyl-CoA-carboxylase] ligase